MTSKPTTSIFNYDQLDTGICATLQSHAAEISRLAQDAATDLWQMGMILADAQERLAAYGNGTFQRWVEAETIVGIRTAYRVMGVYRAFDYANLAQTSFATSALYALSEPSTPVEAWEEAMYRAGRGETITHAKAQEIVATYKPKPAPAPPLPLERNDAYQAYERDVLRPQLRDAGKPDAPQMLSGRKEPPRPVSEARKEQARLRLREAILERLVGIRRVVANRIHCLLGRCGGLAVLNDPKYRRARARLVAEYDDLDGDDQEELCGEADELLALLGKSANSIAVAARFGVALAQGPKTLNDLTEIAIWTCGESVDGMDRAEYLRWRKRTIRWVDAISYVNGLPAFEHTLESGQICYALLEPTSTGTT